ncbi:NAD-dependent succinate-semialdehyde dehydrogenase [Sinorhizobium medicae]|uniref:NAD-dependent succinate-semialdehyde dehydrogenase n=1 Tax=Sinorhizobium medicae TaxID=110321 RepID=UPI000FD8D662|nr:NAD-dependent succinate-semialdehyde dehydrogenase [Sinorhizobium medicae]RVO80336.1 NAD-dependent succinate-semialdehyde dehydrogenase [Sinorhizobium medicae]
MNPESTAPAYGRLGMLIDGRWVYEAEGSSDVVNPATGQTIARLPHASDSEIAEAVASSQRAFESWKDRSPLERSHILRRFADLARKHAEEIAANMTLDQGKPLGEAIGEVRFAADHADWHAEEARRTYGRIIPSRDPRVQQMVVREPVGVCVAFTPWNFPFSQALRKVVAALASGCTIILKGPGESPSSTVAIGRLMQEAGLPDGCLNIVWGDPAHLSESLLGAPEVRKLSFTGSVGVGKHLASLAGKYMKRSTMELGGHAPVIVFDDADIEAAADALAGQKVRNAGQVCISPTRFYVQAKEHDRFLARFTERIASTKFGDGFQEGVQMGPLCHSRRLAAMEDFVQDAREQGATIVTGGERIGNAGFFYAPTVVAGGTDELRLMKAEPFGPIAVVTPFGNFDEVIRRANSLPFGLASYVFTASSNRAQHAAQALAAGMVSINHFGLALPETPFGGINDSGYGSEGGSETLDGYLNTKFVTRFDQIPQ